MDSVVETLVPCLFHFVSKFSHFSLFHPSLFIQYSTEECSTVQLFIYKTSGSRHYRPAPSSAYAIHLVYWHQSYNYNEAIRRKGIQSPSKRRSYVTPGGVPQFGPMVYTLYIGINLTIIMKQYGDRQTDTNI